MKYHQLTAEERYMLAALLWQGHNYSEIARQLGRHRSTVMREVRRNLCNDGGYRAAKAIRRTQARRHQARRKWHFADHHWQMVISLLRLEWSPRQISGWLARHRVFSISHETIYRFIWYDRFYGGTLYLHLRQAGKKWRKRYRSVDLRGVMPGKRHISERPRGAEHRSRVGHWEIDTVIGDRDQHCIVTLVERKTAYTLIGKLKARTTDELNRRVVQLLQGQRRTVRTITADNGTEFHQFREIETRTGARFYFATPHHSWERGLNENTNGLIRQYLPKGQSMAHLTQADCDAIAHRLNTRPRERLGFLTPEQCYESR